MAAHYDADSATEIRVFDSQSITDLLVFIQKEAANGVDLFIGPLGKTKSPPLLKRACVRSWPSIDSPYRTSAHQWQPISIWSCTGGRGHSDSPARAKRTNIGACYSLRPAIIGGRSVEAYQSATEGFDTKTIIARDTMMTLPTRNLFAKFLRSTRAKRDRMNCVE